MPFIRPRLRLIFLVAAGSALSCTNTDRVTAPVVKARLNGTAPSGATLLATGTCGSTCVLFNTTAPLWSAIANPDSNAIPVSIADIRFAPAVGDSVVLHLSGDSVLINGLNPNEAVDVTDSVVHMRSSLRALTSAVVVWRFSATDTTTLHVTLNRALATGVSGTLVLTSTSSAAIVRASRPWIAPDDGSTGPTMSVMRSPFTTLLSDVAPGCGTSGIAIFQNGTYCGVTIRFIQAVPADAFQAAGAKFQSDPGHGVSHGITITFDQPVASVSVTAYDPTFDGNTMAAFDSHNTRIDTAAFPGNHRPGMLTTQLRTLSGAISSVVLTPAPLDYVAYSMVVSFVTAPTVEIVSARGRNLGGSFTVLDTESVISLQANVTPANLAPNVEWEVVPLNSLVHSIPPDSVPRGASTSFVVPATNIDKSRWPGRGTHTPFTPAQKASQLALKSLGYRITAKITANGQTVRSLPVTVQQDEIDTIREEYVEFRLLRVLDRSEFGQVYDAHRNATADYTVWPTGPRLLTNMPIMQALAVQSFGQEAVAFSGYRNPVHHFLHAGATAFDSQHLYGNATDWTITDPSQRPAGMSRDDWFTHLFEMTRDPTVDGCWEPASEIIKTSNTRSLDHAHSDWRNMSACSLKWRHR